MMKLFTKEITMKAPQLVAQIIPQQLNQAMSNTQEISWEQLHERLEQPDLNLELLTAIGAMFSTWKSVFKTKMNSADWDISTAIRWTEALTKLSITPFEFELAYKESIIHEWQPTTPANVIGLVREKIKSEYPDSHIAFKFACQNEGKTSDIKECYEHPVIAETIRRLDSFSLKSADNRFFNVWHETYQRVIDEHKNGAIFSSNIQKQIQLKSTDVVSPDRAQEFIDKINKIFGKKI